MNQICQFQLLKIKLNKKQQVLAKSHKVKAKKKSQTIVHQHLKLNAVLLHKAHPLKQAILLFPARM